MDVASYEAGKICRVGGGFWGEKMMQTQTVTWVSGLPKEFVM